MVSNKQCNIYVTILFFVGSCCCCCFRFAIIYHDYVFIYPELQLAEECELVRGEEAEYFQPK